MKSRWWIGAPLVWAAVVAVVAMLAWSVIARAGESVLSDAPTPVPTTTAPTDDQDRERPRSKGADSRAITPTPTTTESSTADATSTAEPTGVTSPSTQTEADEQPEAPEASEPVRRTSTWQGEAGTLRVSCAGSSIRLESASPSNGYRVDKNEHNGDSELEVRFRSTDGERRTEIHARCVGGTPRFEVDVDND